MVVIVGCNRKFLAPRTFHKFLLAPSNSDQVSGHAIGIVSPGAVVVRILPCADYAYGVSTFVGHTRQMLNAFLFSALNICNVNEPTVSKTRAVRVYNISVQGLIFS